MTKSPPQKRLSVNVSHALFSLLDFLALEDGTDRLSWNVGREFPVHAVQYLTRVQISHDDLVMQAFVWLWMVWFRAIRFGTVQFSTSYMNLR